MTITDILTACVTGPFVVEYLHPADGRWVPLSSRYDDCHDAIERGKRVAANTRVVTIEGVVLWTS